MNSQFVTNPVPGDMYYRHSSAPSQDFTLSFRILLDNWINWLELGSTEEDIRRSDLYISSYPISEEAMTYALKLVG
jgi:hypothetical protein